MPTKRCCCGGAGGCLGCCFPWETFNFPPPGRNVTNLKWLIDAPNCAALHCQSGDFSPETTGPHEEVGGCGNCLCFENNAPGPLFINGVAYADVGGNCEALTPCGFSMCFGLTCDADRIHSPDVGIAECCSAIKLLVKLSGFDGIEGGIGLNLSGECFEGLLLGEEPVWPGCPSAPGSINIYLSPVSCTCPDPEDPEDTGCNFEVVYDLEELIPTCSLDFPPGHPCVGIKGDCCYMDDPTLPCDLTGATLIVYPATCADPISCP